MNSHRYLYYLFSNPEYLKTYEEGKISALNKETYLNPYSKKSFDFSSSSYLAAGYKDGYNENHKTERYIIGYNLAKSHQNNKEKANNIFIDKKSIDQTDEAYFGYYAGWNEDI